MFSLLDYVFYFIIFNCRLVLAFLQIPREHACETTFMQDLLVRLVGNKTGIVGK